MALDNKSDEFVNSRLRLAYVTSQFPYGKAEAFAGTELNELRRIVQDLVILPVRPQSALYHSSGRQLVDCAIPATRLPLLLLIIVLRMLILQPRTTVHIFTRLLTQGRLKVRLKNFAALPIGIYAAYLARQRKVTHIHAFWASVPATVAWIASQYTGIAFSFTAHRWDISEDNLLKVKTAQASFARTISEAGKTELLAIAGERYADKVHVLHVGVTAPSGYPSEPIKVRRNGKFTFACIANLEEKKGHKYLLQACCLLRERGVDFNCLLIGDGHLAHSIDQTVAISGLQGNVHRFGAVPHEEVMKMLESGMIDVVVLPSITTPSGEKEGIPVVLMEALSRRVAVIATTSGAITELLDATNSIQVPEKDALPLADAIMHMMQNPSLRLTLGERGFQRVMRDFNCQKTVEEMSQLIIGSNLNG